WGGGWGDCYQCLPWKPQGVCLAFYESHFDTAIVDHEADGSTSNGIFQINSHLWCEDYKHFQPNFCKMHCSDLLTSDIKDDIVCAMRIAQGPRGLGAWYHCSV
uniref:Sperm acrosome associated 3 n=1 Tax=Podarcis muralis TaxID=64176 RepID=A0A670K154_PODMU